MEKPTKEDQRVNWEDLSHVPSTIKTEKDVLYVEKKDIGHFKSAYSANVAA